MADPAALRNAQILNSALLLKLLLRSFSLHPMGSDRQLCTGYLYPSS